MDTNALKKFAQAARNLLMEQVKGKLGLVLAEGSPARREAPQAVRDLETAIRQSSKELVIEQVAYTWFNRFTALRFMDANGYTAIRVVSPADGQTRPEILADALAGNIDASVPGAVRDRITMLLDGRSPSSDGQGEAYRLLLVAACNQWHEHMPFMFEKINDYTELLMPGDLLSQNSVLARLREAMTEDACKDVEIIGWLYQFYISEKKDQVFAGLKKNVKITAENIPAATQLFTPHWIVRYLVENSLGRLWLLNRPASRLADQMDYYIAPEEPETDFLRTARPQDIRICDPAAGSGHMLTYAFDLLYAIYEEEGYDPTDIPALILTHNLTGVEIDDRAGALAAFALAMKAAAKLGRRRFLRMEAKPDICVLQNVAFTDAEMQDVAAVVSKDMFTDELRETLSQFEQAKNFGSLIVPKLRDPAETLRVVEAREFAGDLLLKEVQARVIAVLRMAEALSPQYHVVVANPPYMGWGGMNGRLQDFAKAHYADSKNDLFAMFMERTLEATVTHGFVGMINMQAWMFLSSFEKLRGKITSNAAIVSMAHLGERGFDTIGGAVVSTTAFVLESSGSKSKPGDFLRLVSGRSEAEKSEHARRIISGSDYSGRHRVRTTDIRKIPGNPIAYWISDFSIFEQDKVSNNWTSGGRLKTHDGPKYIRFMWEVSTASTRWKRVAKGGEFRRFYGNEDSIADWSEDALAFYREMGGLPPEKFWGKTGISWTKITTSSPSFRINGSLTEYDSASPTILPSDDTVALQPTLGFLNTKVSSYLLDALNPTINFQVADVLSLPHVGLARETENCVSEAVQRLTALARADWDAYETSWDFSTLPLFQPDRLTETLEDSYAALRTHWQDMTDEMQRLEEENNRIFIDAYGLQAELTPEVPLNEISLTCNPAYRYGIKNDAAANETRLRADTMAEFLSYAVGCMFGRYSLDAPGLILANQGETLVDYLAQVPGPTFMPDADNVIPVLDAEWFPDDITERFRLFLRTTFGEENYRENLAFVEDALGKDIRKYFTKDFYTAHVQRYKKRPIYWMFSSPKGTFNALIYMHRYNGVTVSVLLNDYLRELIRKLEAHRSSLEKLADDPSTVAAKATKATKDVLTVSQQIEELKDWERDVVFPLAQQRIEIDLDDGVKANYPKFGAALKLIKGLDATDE